MSKLPNACKFYQTHVEVTKSISKLPNVYRGYQTYVKITKRISKLPNLYRSYQKYVEVTKVYRNYQKYVEVTQSMSKLACDTLLDIDKPDIKGRLLFEEISSIKGQEK